MSDSKKFPSSVLSGVSDRRSAIKGVFGGALSFGFLGGVSGASAQSAGVKSVAAPASRAELVDMPAWKLSLSIQNKQVSCEEVMGAFLQQADKFNGKVNAFVARQGTEQLINQAREKDRILAAKGPEGWMHGFPQAIKDLADTQGIVTTYGSPSFKDNVPKRDSMMVAQMRSAGSIIVAKTNTPEWGFGSHTYNPVYGTTANAYDQSVSAGGSSGGAAVSLALRMQPVADGSDFMGSLRNPAGWNCVFGYRPSWGRVPMPGKELFFNQFGINGPMARSVPDLALLLATQSGYEPMVPASLSTDDHLSLITPSNVTGLLKADQRGKKIAWLGDWNGYLATEDGVLDVCQKALRVFENMGMVVEPIKNPTDPERFWNEVWLPHRHLCATGQSALYENPVSRALAKPEAVWEYDGSKKYSGQDAYNASIKRSDWYRVVAELFKKYDYIVVPTAQIFAFDKELPWPKTVGGRSMDTYHRWMEVVSHWTMSGNPVAALPAGKNAKGLWNGIQVVGRPRGDWELLQLAYAYERATDIVNMNRPALLA